MKNVIKLLSMMLIAGTVMVSCTEKPNNPENPTPVTPKYTITVTSNDETMGTVTGGGTYDEGTTITITAIPNSDYRFVKWQDGVTEPSRSIIVSKDETYTATFEANAPAEGINVTFGSDQWTSGYFGIPYYSSLNFMDIIAYKTQGQPYPSIDIIATAAVGTFSEDANSTNGSMSGTTFYNVDYYYQSSLYSINTETGDTSWFGDWWAKSATINTTNFDATNMTITTVINATMFDANAAFVQRLGMENASTKTMTVAVGNCDLMNVGQKATIAPKTRNTKLAVK